jgi:hypothetical protein
MNMRRSQDDALIPVDVAGSIRSNRARIRLDVLDRQQSGGLSYPRGERQASIDAVGLGLGLSARCFVSLFAKALGKFDTDEARLARK